MSYKDDFSTIKAIIAEHQKLIKTALIPLASEVDSLMQHSVTDDNRIGALLDRLLDYAGFCEDGLNLFKRLCRYYYGINPQAASEYVLAYKDMYDDESDSQNNDK